MPRASPSQLIMTSIDCAAKRYPDHHRVCPTEQVVFGGSTWEDAHVDGSTSPRRSEPPKASDFLPGFADIPEPLITGQGFFPSASSVCAGI